MRIDSASSLTEPMCQPPRQAIETFAPDRPRTLCGRPVAEALLVWANTSCASAAMDAALKKSRLELEVCSMIREVYREGARNGRVSDGSDLRKRYRRFKTSDFTSTEALGVTSNCLSSAQAFPALPCAEANRGWEMAAVALPEGSSTLCLPIPHGFPRPPRRGAPGKDIAPSLHSGQLAPL